MSHFTASLRKVIFTLLRLILTLVFISVCPVLLVLCSILYLYRYAISKAARYVDPQLGKLVSALSNLFAAHNVYGNSYAINIALHVVGKIDKEHLIRGFKNLLELKAADGPTPLYPEMRQRIVKRFGYTFWRNVDNFRVEDHIEYLDLKEPEKPVTQEGIRRTIAKFGKTPFNRTRSPWMVYVVKNFQSESEPKVKSAMILRLHHAMFDGHSVMNVFSKMVDNGPLQLPVQSRPQSTEAVGIIEALKKVVIRPLTICFRGPYELMGQLMSYDRNELVEKSKSEFKGVMRFHECEPIPLEELKKIRRHFGVSLASVLATLAGRSLKKFMEKRGITERKVRMTFPLPVPDHPDKLRNYFAGGIISFDFSHDDRVKLLHSVEQKFFQFRYTLSSGLPEASVFLLRILGSLPSVFVPVIDNLPLSCTMMNSSIPGPIHTGYYCGFPIVDATAAGSISKPYPIGTLSYSYRGYYKFGWSGDTSIMKTQEEIQELGDEVMNELHEFQRLVEENCT